MKKNIAVAVLMLGATLASAESNQSCLAVYPIGGNRLKGIAEGGYVGLALAHGERFAYLESTNLPVGDVRVNYKKKDLEKLESRGVRIVVTTKEALSVRNQHSDQGNANSSSGQSNATVTASAGCQ
jgi:hypothetical protein